MPSAPLRSKSHAVVAWLGTLVVAAVAIAIVIVAITGSHAANLIPGVILLAVAGAGVRYARAAVIADPSAPELVARNPLRTARIPWGEIRGFDTADSRLTRGGSFQRRLIVATLDGNRQLVLVGVCAWSHAEVQHLLGELNAARDAGRQHHTRGQRVTAPS